MSEQIPTLIVQYGIVGVALYMGYNILNKVIDKLDAVKTSIDALSVKIETLCANIGKGKTD